MNIYEIYTELIGLSPCTEKCPWLSTDDGDPWSPVDLGSTYGNPCALMLDGKIVPETPFFLVGKIRELQYTYGGFI